MFAALKIDGAAWWIITIALLAFALYLFLPYYPYTCDDAAISFAYAKNLALGHGWVLGPGEQAIEAFSNPLWVVILSICYRVGFHDLVEVSKILSAILYIFSLLILADLPSKIQSRPRQMLDLSGLLFVITMPPVLVWTGSGLEQSLYIFLILLAIWMEQLCNVFASSRSQEVHFLWHCLSAFCVVCIIGTRPEGLLYAAPFVFNRFLRIARKVYYRQNRIGPDIRFILIFVVGVFAITVWRYINFHDVLPNTYYAKVAYVLNNFGKEYLHEHGLLYLTHFFQRYSYWSLVPVVLITVLILRKTTIFILSFLLAVSLFCPYRVGGDWMNDFRFMQSFIWLAALFYGLFSGSIRCLLLSISVRTGVLSRKKWCVLGTGCSLVFLSCVLFLRERGVPLRRGKVPSPALLLENNATVRSALLKLSKHLGISNPVVLMPDIGAISYGGGVRIVDIARLADTTLAKEYDINIRKAYLYVERRPDFVYLHHKWAKLPEVIPIELQRAGYVRLNKGKHVRFRRHGKVYARNELFFQSSELMLRKGWTTVTPQWKIHCPKILSVNKQKEKDVIDIPIDIYSSTNSKIKLEVRLRKLGRNTLAGDIYSQGSLSSRYWRESSGLIFNLELTVADGIFAGTCPNKRVCRSVLSTSKVISSGKYALESLVRSVDHQRTWQQISTVSVHESSTDIFRDGLVGEYCTRMSNGTESGSRDILAYTIRNWARLRKGVVENGSCRMALMDVILSYISDESTQDFEKYMVLSRIRRLHRIFENEMIDNAILDRRYRGNAIKALANTRTIRSNDRGSLTTNQRGLFQHLGEIPPD